MRLVRASVTSATYHRGVTPHDPLLGKAIDGRFRLDRLLGAGGMGKVYAATQLSVGRHVAVKVLRSDLSELPTLQQRFFREAQLIASLRHPNIVGLVDFGQDDALGSLYIVMEFVEGRTLTSLLAEGRPPLPLALSICRQVCSGLAEAHAAGIVHRDLKPDNVMLQVTAEGAVHAKLLDFGIALPQGRDETRFTAAGDVVGTPFYMSPEQATDRPVDHRADLYALGVILYEMIAGRVPFAADTPLAALFKTVNEQHKPLGELGDVDLPPGPVAELIDDLLAKDPAARPASAAEVGRRLEQLLSGLTNQLPRVANVAELTGVLKPHGAYTPVPASLDPPSTAQDAPPLAPPPPRKPSSGLPFGAVVAVLGCLGVVAVAVVIIAGVIFAIGRGAQETRAPQPPPAASSPTPLIEERTERDGPAEAAPAPPVAEPKAPAAEPPPAPRPPERKKADRKKKPPRDKKSARLEDVEQEHYACQGRKCAVDFPDGGGHLVCQNGAECTGDCSGGGCRQTCQNSECDFRCSGGGCAQVCMSGAECRLSCSGGGCERTVLSAKDVQVEDDE